MNVTDAKRMMYFPSQVVSRSFGKQNNPSCPGWRTPLAGPRTGLWSLQGGSPEKDLGPEAGVPLIPCGLISKLKTLPYLVLRTIVVKRIKYQLVTYCRNLPQSKCQSSKNIDTSVTSENKRSFLKKTKWLATEQTWVVRDIL